MRTIGLLMMLGVPLAVAGERDRVRAAFAFQQALEAQRLRDAGKGWASPLPFPEGAQRYEPTRWTQSIFILNERDVIDRVPITGLERKWHQSGGMEGVEGVTSEKYRLVPKPPKEWVDNIPVKNSFGYHQENRGLKREYANGTRFDDVLFYKGEVFEHRTREKEGGRWQARVAYKNEAARPPGYTGLTVTCASCHSESGSGKYGVGLVPGGDTVLSDPLPWKLARGRER